MRDFTALFLLFFAYSGFTQSVVFENFPNDNQLFQRETASNVATVPVSGYVEESSGYERVKLTLSDEHGIISEEEQNLTYNALGRGLFSFQIPVPAERNNHEITVSALNNSIWIPVKIAQKILAGDIFIILGQSNAEAGAAPDLSDVDEYTRSWFPPFGWGTLNLSFPGQWGARIAKVISEQENLPIAIFNQAIGAEPITTFLRDETDNTIGNYGDLMKRFENAGLDKNARGAFWFHGEADSWTTDPEDYFNNFKKLKEAWEEDYGIERTFVFQMRYQSCDSPNPKILEVHRRLNEELPRIDVLSTLNSAHDSCHFYYENGYKILGERMAAIMTNRLYGGTNQLAYSPSVEFAKLSDSDSRILEISFKNNPELMLVGDFPTEDFSLENSPVNVIGGRIVNSGIELFLDDDLEFSSGINYLGHLGQTPNWITNTAGVGALTFHSFPIDGVPDLGPDLNCYADYSVDGLEVTISNFDAPIAAVKLLDKNFEAFFSCDNWGGTPCNSTEKITLPATGDYFIRIQTFHNFSLEICNILEPIYATEPIDPCAYSGSDADGDGFCADIDCNDNNPDISQPGDACDDGNPLTENDIIQNDCSCSGQVLPPCANAGGDADGDGFCADIDCNDNNPNLNQPGDACNDGNPLTENDILRQDCSCRGEIPPPCINAGGDTDGDGVCDDMDCRPNNPNISNTGDLCDDNNPDTENDIIQADCSCLGTPIVQNNPCDVIYTIISDEVRVNMPVAPIHFVKIMDVTFQSVFECNSWNSSCSNDISYKFTEPGTYYLQIQTQEDWATPAICDIFERIEILQSQIPTCENVTSGGGIRGDEIICPDIRPERIRSDGLPTGGVGAIEYRWLSSTTGCPNDLSQTVPRAINATHRPNLLSETTYYRRLSKRADCTNWFAGESNCIVKTVDNCTPPVPDCTVEYSINDSGINVTGLNYPIVSIRVTDEQLDQHFFECNSWLTACNNPQEILLDPGVYFLGVQTFETWDEPRCEILEKIEITGSNLQNAPISFRKNGNVSENEITVYPNPARNQLNVSLPDIEKKDISIQIMDQLGKNRFEITFENNSNPILSLPIQNLASGVYTLWIFPKGEKPISKRVLIRKD